MPFPLAAAVIGSSLISGAAGMFGASKAADAQIKSTRMATDFQREMFEKARKDLEPYLDLGQFSAEELQELMPYFTSAIEMDQETLEQTPGYQFTKEQGQRAIDAKLAQLGMGRSPGAVARRAGEYATGLADQTYKTQFDIENINRTNAYNRLMEAIKVGGNAASKMGNQAITTGASVGNNLVGAGNAQAGSYIRMADSIGETAQSVPTAMLMNRLLSTGKAPTTTGMYSGWDTRISSLGIA